MFGWTIRPRLYESGISEDYLSDMAAKGWHLKRLGQSLVLFKKGIPAKVRYAVDVIDRKHLKWDEKLEGDSIQEYIRICEESGWQLVDNDSTFYVFAAKDENAVPLQTDPEAYAQTMFSERQSSLLRLLLGVVLMFAVVGSVVFAPHRYLAWPVGPALWLTAILILADWLLRLGYVLWRLIREDRAMSLGQIPGGAYGRWITWIIFVTDGIALAVIAAAWSQTLGVSVWLFVPGVLLAILLATVIGEWLGSIGWKRLRYSRGGARRLQSVPTVLIIIAIYWVPTLLDNAGMLPSRRQEPPAGWQPVVTAADFGWSGDMATLYYSSSICANEYDMWEGTGREQLRSILYVSEIEALLNSFYQKGPEHSEWWNRSEKVEEQRELDSAWLGVEEGLAWKTNTDYWHYLLRVGDRVLYLRAGQELTDEQLALAAERLLASVSRELRPAAFARDRMLTALETAPCASCAARG